MLNATRNGGVKRLTGQHAASLENNDHTFELAALALVEGNPVSVGQMFQVLGRDVNPHALEVGSKYWGVRQGTVHRFLDEAERSVPQAQWVVVAGEHHLVTLLEVDFRSRRCPDFSIRGTEVGHSAIILAVSLVHRDIDGLNAARSIAQRRESLNFVMAAASQILEESQNTASQAGRGTLQRS